MRIFPINYRLMHRRNFLRNSGLFLGSGLLFQQQLLAHMIDDPFKIQMLRDDLGIFTEKGGTIAFLFTSEGIVVVDSQFPEQSQHLIDELKKRNSNPFRLLINTHHHGDHTAGNISFKGLVPHVAAHTNSFLNQQRVAKEKNTEDQQLYPDITYGDTWEYKKMKENIKTYYW